MLAQEARERLKTFQVKGYKKRLRRINTLPLKLRSPAKILLGENQENLYFRLRQHDPKAFSKALEHIDQLSSKDRCKLFAAFFPKFPQAIEQAWQRAKTLPYQTGYVRKAFRSPHRPKETLAARGAWLSSLIRRTHSYDQPLSWYAAWAPYLGYGMDDLLAYLFAAAIDLADEEGERVLKVLLASGRNEHPIGSMGRHVTRTFLLIDKPAAWGFIKDMLIAAQRQEGLRQAILEAVDEAQPQAFVFLLACIVQENLCRFAAAIRAVDVWFDFQFDTSQTKQVNKLLSKLLRCLQEEEYKASLLVSEEAEDRYLALWATAFKDVEEAVLKAKDCLSNNEPDIRYVGVHFLVQAKVASARRLLLPMMKDDDLQVAYRALDGFRGFEADYPEMFDLVISLAERTAKKQSLAPRVWSWTERQIRQAEQFAYLPYCLVKRPVTDLTPYIKRMNSDGRYQVVYVIRKKLAERQAVSPEEEALLLQFVGDISSQVRSLTQECLKDLEISPSQAKRLEPLLSRKAEDLRRNVIALLLKQKDDEALASAERLLQAKSAKEREAGQEIRKELVKNKRAKKRLLKDDQQEAQDRDKPSLDNALGLYISSERSPIKQPKKHKGPFVSKASKNLLLALDQLIAEHKDTVVLIKDYRGEREELLGNLGWSFPMLPRDKAKENWSDLPLAELWRNWWQSRPEALRDKDGLEIYRIVQWLYRQHPLGQGSPLWSRRMSRRFIPKVGKLHYEKITHRLLSWFFASELSTQGIDFMLDAFETSLATLPDSLFAFYIPEEERLSSPNQFGNGRNHQAVQAYVAMLEESLVRDESLWTKEQISRYWGLWRYLDEGLANAPRYRPSLALALKAWQIGSASKADLYDQLLGTRDARGRYSFGWGFAQLAELTTYKPYSLFETLPELKAIVDACRERILAVESTRGELATVVSGAALSLRSIYGAEHVLILLKALGSQPLVRGYTYDNLSKSAVFSHLLKHSFPTEHDTEEDFKARACRLKLSEQRLLDLAVYAPQWAEYVAYTLGWPSLTEAVYWLHAHTKDIRWRVARDIKDLWEANIAEYTPLKVQTLLDGAVDVAWFKRVYQALGETYWRRLFVSAKYASGGNGHKRAQLFAEALLGKLNVEELITRVETKRHQDALRALGLLPIQKEQEVLERYEVIATFLRSGKSFGAQRKASEQLAADIALENLARTAGYPDPQRLRWAMEMQAVSDLAQGPIRLTKGKVSLSLSIEQGLPELRIEKGERILKAVPAQLRKEPDVMALVKRKKSLQQQVSRMRRSLEEAMCRRDAFSAREVKDLSQHPLLSPMLKDLVFFTEAESLGCIDAKANGLLGPKGESFPLEGQIRLAHPVDFLVSGEWHLWQHYCFQAKITQAFKQIFREVYPITSQEKEAKFSSRYAGQQVNPSQALGILAKRAWLRVPEEGLRRSFHSEDISAWLFFDEGVYTPAEVDGLTLASLSFTKRVTGEPLAPKDVPAIVFSEVMRDLDLVVSVAHRGGVDPEASASTVEMRMSLLRETLGLLGLNNVELKDSHALIKGELNHYSLHLGSGTVHRQPGGALCIIPVPSQQRGRLFLPFADDDPKTAEIVSKVLLLAKDKELKDPTILEQLR